VQEKYCIFCKIIKKDIPSKIIKETEYILVIKDLHPKAPYHYLIIPKKHIINLNYLEELDSHYLLDVAKIAKQIAIDIQKEKGLSGPASFNLISNNGADAGQSVFHMHWHFLAGKDLYKGDLKL
jgi:histidine triad (HIT) family protein